MYTYIYGMGHIPDKTDNENKMERFFYDKGAFG